MKHTIENISDIEKKISIEIPEEEIKKEIESAFDYFQKNAEIKGFRKGKVPRSIIEKNYRNDVEADVISKLINDSYSKTLDENHLTPISYPAIDAGKYEAGKDYSYKATFQIKPEIKIENYEGLELTKTKVEITEKDVEAVLNHLRENQSILKPKDTDSAREGDFAIIEVTAFQDGKQLTPENKKTQTVEIGKKYLHPAIEEAILKMKKGEEKTVMTKLDEKLSNKKLAGKQTEFKVKLIEIREKELPLLDDNFARSLGPHKDLSDLKEQIKEEVRIEREKQANTKLESQALKTLDEKNNFQIPPVMIEAEIEHLTEDFKAQLSRQGFPEDAQKTQIEKLKDQFKEEATRRTKQTLILEAIGKKEALSAEEQDIQKRHEIMAKNLNAPLEKVKEYYSKEHLLEDLKAHIVAEKTLDLILKKANIKIE